MTYEIKIGDPVEFWFNDETNSTRLLNGGVCFVERRVEGERPIIVCSTGELYPHVDTNLKEK